MPCLLLCVKPYGNNPHRKSLSFFSICMQIKTIGEAGMGCLPRNGVRGLFCPLPSEQQDRVSNQWGEDLSPECGRGRPAPRCVFAEECWVLGSLLLHPICIGRSFGFAEKLPLIPPSADPAMSGCSGTAIGFAGKMHPSSHCFPSRTFLLQMHFSCSKHRRQGDGLWMALSPCNRNTMRAQPWHYSCREMSCPRKLAGSRDGFPWAQGVGAATREASLKRLYLSSEGTSWTFSCSNVHQTVLVLVPVASSNSAGRAAAGSGQG